VSLGARAGLELWGGLECTVNRVGDSYFDQVRRSGHQGRPEDLERFAELGLRTLRYPVLWERTAPGGLGSADWSWPDARLRRLRELGIRPIVGLVHHGSGPRHTSLLEPSFAEGLAAFAGAVAERYPWLNLYTPVNEPLTTARFSCLYGHWYPHARDDGSFARALLNECRATVLAMAAVRRANPDAKLVQTEDLGKVYSTPALRDQADFENERRWLTLDLLCGRVDAHHPMWAYLRWVGVPEAELTWFCEHPCPPDVLGFNYYPTSERFLDERVDRYPPSAHGGNGRARYADVEAVRVLEVGLGGPYKLLSEAWARYGLPLAVSEAHLGCTREEQLRWLLEVWEAARWLRDRGCDVRAVTVWSLLGAHDWNSLLTCEGGFYEPGVFDLRAPAPRPTALAGMVRELAAGQQPSHPVLTGPGWWRRPQRLLYPAYPADASEGRAPIRGEKQERPLLVVGASPAFMKVVSRVCNARGLAHHLISWEEFRDQAKRFLCELHPWAVLYAPYAEDGADTGSVKPTRLVADFCEGWGVPLLAFSSSLVFDGLKSEPYLERDPIAPQSALGAAFAEDETHLFPAALTVRTGPLFIQGAALHTWGAAEAAALGGDVRVSPAYLPDVLNTALDLLMDGERGLWHLAAPESVLLSDFLGRIAGHLGPGLKVPRERQGHVLNLALQSERGGPLPPFHDALARCRLERTKGLGDGCNPARSLRRGGPAEPLSRRSL